MIIKTLAEVEHAHIKSVMLIVGGHKGLAAKALGISRATLYRKLRDYGMIKRKKPAKATATTEAKSCDDNNHLPLPIGQVR